jgi:hypothetical protein
MIGAAFSPMSRESWRCFFDRRSCEAWRTTSYKEVSRLFERQPAYSVIGGHLPAAAQSRICRHVNEAMQIFRTTIPAPKTVVRDVEIF